MGSLGEIDIIDENEIQSLNNFMSTSSQPSSDLPLLSLNHVSYVCKSVKNSVRFYVDVLGFFLIKRPSSFKFEGAWLFNYGIGIHLLQSNSVSVSGSVSANEVKKINPKDNHISFQSSDMRVVVEKLKQMKIEYVTAVVEEGGIKVDQLFFHDPDGHMIEICNCHILPVLPLSSCPLKLPRTNPKPHGKLSSETNCHGEAENLTIMENLFSMAMMNIFI